MTIRRTPTITADVRRRFEEALVSDGWRPGETIPRIAQETGLTRDQVRDSIFSESADAWRRGLADRLHRPAP